ncbi:hypothetical protein [Dyadobacter luticola]|uniref:Uncharacterized protein n=1 Tax=Dyadobacter luticola TaxID=1979387 RepID=A0A5R9KXS0_9BACT|nr:hypothetical protein [Dyadobacter luticola]TLV01063.1 hypothetical protein FEN17_16530 [Dyadobacter luticola]
MKNSFSRILAGLIVIFTLPTSIALPETLRNGLNYNPVLLNGEVVSYERLTTSTRGTLTLVEGNPEFFQSKKIPFNIYLIRAGKVVTTGYNAIEKPVMEYELSKILSSARVEDRIVIDPVDKENGIGPRIIQVDRFQLMPQFNWLIGLVKPGKQGC